MKKKRILSAALSAVMAVGCIGAAPQTEVFEPMFERVSAEETESEVLLGDANEDGKLNVRDAAYIASMLAKGKAKELPASADYTGDNIINVRDAAGIARYCAESYNSNKPITTSPVTKPVTTTSTIATSSFTDEPGIIETTVPAVAVTTQTSKLTSATRPAETTAATTTVTEVISRTIDDYVIYYSVTPIKEMHDVETCNVNHETVNLTMKEIELYNNTDFESEEYKKFVETNTKRWFNEDGSINANEANGFVRAQLECGLTPYDIEKSSYLFWKTMEWHEEVFGHYYGNWYTRWNLVGYEYTFKWAAPKEVVLERFGAIPSNNEIFVNPEVYFDGKCLSTEQLSEELGFEVPKTFTSSRFVDVEGNIYEAYEEGREGSNPEYLNGFWSLTCVSRTTAHSPYCTHPYDSGSMGYYNVLNYYDQLAEAPVIYYGDMIWLNMWRDAGIDYNEISEKYNELLSEYLS